MAERSQAEMVHELRTRWRRWTGILRLVASRQEARSAVDADQYTAFHAELRRLVHDLAHGADAASQPLLRELEEMLTPWVNLDSLVWAEHEIVYKLLARSQEVQCALDGRPARAAAPGRRKFLVIMGTLGGLVLALSAWATGLVTVPSVRLGPWLRQMVGSVRYDGSSWSLWVAGAALTAMAILLVWRSVRGS